MIESILGTECWDLFSGGISEDTVSESFSVGVKRGYVQCLVLIFLRLLGSGWFHAPYRKFYICTNYWNIYLFVAAIMYSTASPVFLCAVRFIILCFYQLIDFLANFWQITKHIVASWTFTRLLVRIIVLGCSWYHAQSTSLVSKVLF